MVPETQLLRINAEAANGLRAKQIADTYAAVFIEYAGQNLSDTTQATISLADRAPVSRSPSRPKPKLYVLVAAILGGALGLALAFLRERLDKRLRTPEEVEEQFDVPILARIPRFGRSDRSATAFREANRILRTNLQFASVGRQVQTIAVTSAREGEGKTTTVANIALATAEVGASALIVEADLRRPALQHEVMPEVEEPAATGADQLPGRGGRHRGLDPPDRPPRHQHHPGGAAATEPVGAARVAARAGGGAGRAPSTPTWWCSTARR